MATDASACGDGNVVDRCTTAVVALKPAEGSFRHDIELPAFSGDCEAEMCLLCKPGKL
mgnify:CR=1 FL=1